jgi:hypothetical protein
MNTDLVPLETFTPVAIFSQGGTDQLLADIKKAATSEVHDPSTYKGRNAITAMATRVTKSKIRLDKMGKDLADSLNQQLKPINEERKKVRDRLDALKKEVRQPLTDWETAEEKRIAAEAKAQEMEAYHGEALIMNQVHDLKREKELLEAEAEAQRLIQKKEADYAEAIAMNRVHDLEREQQRREAEEAAKQLIQKKESEHTEAIAMNRVHDLEREQQRKEAEETAKQLIQKKEADHTEAIAMNEVYDLEREKQRKEAALASVRASQEQLEREARQQQEQKELIKQAAEEARQKTLAEEQERQQIEKFELEEQARKRKTDKERRHAVHIAVKQALRSLGLDDQTAISVIMAIKDNKVPHVAITY